MKGQDKEFLRFQLYGPLAAWGNVAVGEQRPSAAHPSKSAIMGLVAAAFGIRRNEEEKIGEINRAYGFAVRVNSPGELMRDYHTSQVPPDKHKAKFYTRRDELANDELYTILSSRDYRMEACYTIAIWVKETAAPFTLEELAAAIRQPKLILYLGRKSCPVAIPIKPEIVLSATLKYALDQAELPNEFLGKLPIGKLVSYYWEELEDNALGMSATMVYPRRDQLLSRSRWQFSERNEYYCAEPRKEEII